MGVQTTKVQPIGDIAGELLKAFRAHYVASCDFGNTICAVHGVASPAGRIIDRTMNSAASMYLDCDFRWLGDERGYWRYEEISLDENGRKRQPPPSAAAQRIIDCAIHSQGPCKSPFTPEAAAACRTYADERLSLLQQIEALFEAAFKATRSDGPRRWARQIAKERKYAERMQAILAE